MSHASLNLVCYSRERAVRICLKEVKHSQMTSPTRPFAWKLWQFRSDVHLHAKVTVFRLIRCVNDFLFLRCPCLELCVLPLGVLLGSSLLDLSQGCAEPQRGKRMEPVPGRDNPNQFSCKLQTKVCRQQMCTS